jgi:hypothetical protein
MPIVSSIRQLADGRGTAVETGSQDHRRIGGIDDDRRHAMRGQPDAQGRPDQAAAENDDVAIHANAPRPSSRAKQCVLDMRRHALRLDVRTARGDDISWDFSQNLRHS